MIFCIPKNRNDTFQHDRVTRQRDPSSLAFCRGLMPRGVEKNFHLPADGVSFSNKGDKLGLARSLTGSRETPCRVTWFVRSERWAMAESGQAPKTVKWRTCGAATLLIAAFSGFTDAGEERLSGLGGVTASASGEI